MNTEKGKTVTGVNNAGCEIRPDSCCGSFSPRKSAVVPRRECWFCRYADFHIDEPVALSIGKCCWPDIKVD